MLFDIQSSSFLVSLPPSETKIYLVALSYWQLFRSLPQSTRILLGLWKGLALDFC
jgi:hypothetical protein